MERFEIKILKLNVTETTLNIGIKVTGEYNPKVRNPIVTIIFTSGDKYRRLPIPITAYQPEINLKKFFILAEYFYSLEDLFIDYKNTDKLEAKIEFSYGRQFFSDLVLNPAKDINITGSKKYSAFINDDNLGISLIRTANDRNQVVKAIIQGLSGIISFIWDIFLFALAVILMPFFFVEALLEDLAIISTSAPKKYKRIMGIIEHMRWRTELILDKKIGLSTFKNLMTKLGFYLFKFSKLKNNRVTFISNRRNRISGNYENIYK